MSKPTARTTALRWAFACLAAAAAGVLVSYCWRVFYYLDSRISPLIVTAGCAGFALALVGAAALVRYAARDFAARGALCIALCGLLFVFANPPMQAPDESQYYLRCDSISRGHFDFDASRAYPDDVAALYNAFPGAWVNAHTSQGTMRDPADPDGATVYTTGGYALKQYGEAGAVQSVADSFAAYFDTKNQPPETPVTEPVSFLILPFLPQALGMALARLLGFGALGCFYGGRIANLAAYTALCWLALKRAGRWRPALLAVMLLPLSLFLAGSLSYDATLLGCYYLMAALLARTEWDTPTAAVYLAACVFVNVAKPYLNLLWVFLPLALPKTTFRAKGRCWMWLAAMLAGSLAATMLVEWYGTAFRFNYPVIERMGGEDVNQMAQLLFILKNPLRFVAVLAGTLYENDFFIGQLGLFGWKDLPVNLLNLTGPVMLCLGAALSAGGDGPLCPRTRRGTAAFCLLYGVGAMTAMYITYTPVSMVRIVGLQARYFLPVWLLCLTLLADAARRVLRPALSAARGETLALRVFAPYAALGAVLLFQHYWVGPVFTILN
ncbi:MAG: DUF2142 domain-containing protein [Gemmiger sp.]